MFQFLPDRCLLTSCSQCIQRQSLCLSPLLFSANYLFYWYPCAPYRWLGLGVASNSNLGRQPASHLPHLPRPPSCRLCSTSSPTSHLKYPPPPASGFPPSHPGPAVFTFSAAPPAWCTCGLGRPERKDRWKGLILSLPFPPSCFARMPHLPSSPSQPYSWLESIHPPRPILNM